MIASTRLIVSQHSLNIGQNLEPSCQFGHHLATFDQLWQLLDCYCDEKTVNTLCNFEYGAVQKCVNLAVLEKVWSSRSATLLTRIRNPGTGQSNGYAQLFDFESAAASKVSDAAHEDPQTANRVHGVRAISKLERLSALKCTE